MSQAPDLFDKSKLWPGCRREEFKRHKDAKDEFLPTFFLEWEKYRDMLMSQSSQYGADLSESQKLDLTDEQKQQLGKLHTEAQKVGSNE